MADYGKVIRVLSERCHYDARAPVVGTSFKKKEAVVAAKIRYISSSFHHLCINIVRNIPIYINLVCDLWVFPTKIGGSSGISVARGNTDYDVKERTRKKTTFLLERSVYVLFT